jgi:hypothetical protein
MTAIDTIAKEFHMKPKELMKESLKTYLDKRLSKIESELFIVARKYGVTDIFHLDEKIRSGLISEGQAYDDYFLLDNLEAEREKIKGFLSKL